MSKVDYTPVETTTLATKAVAAAKSAGSSATPVGVAATFGMAALMALLL